MQIPTMIAAERMAAAMFLFSQISFSRLNRMHASKSLKPRIARPIPIKPNTSVATSAPPNDVGGQETSDSSVMANADGAVTNSNPLKPSRETDEGIFMAEFLSVAPQKAKLELGVRKGLAEQAT